MPNIVSVALYTTASCFSLFPFIPCGMAAMSHALPAKIVQASPHIGYLFTLSFHLSLRLPPSAFVHHPFLLATLLSGIFNRPFSCTRLIPFPTTFLPRVCFHSNLLSQILHFLFYHITACKKKIQVIKRSEKRTKTRRYYKSSTDNRTRVCKINVQWIIIGTQRLS